jgi:hypothetical protein
VVAGGQHVYTEFEQFLCNLRGQAETRRRILRIRNNQIHTALAHQFRHALAHNRPSRTPEDVTNE